MNHDDKASDGDEPMGWYVFLTLRGPDDADVDEAAARLLSSDLGGEVQPPGEGATSVGAIVKVAPMDRDDACRIIAEKASAVFGPEWTVETQAENPDWRGQRRET